jgi:hypothetical protein
MRLSNQEKNDIVIGDKTTVKDVKGSGHSHFQILSQKLRGSAVANYK